MQIDRIAALRVLTLTLLVIPLEACASSQRGAPASLDDRTPSGGILLSVENRNSTDARAYLVRPGLRIRLGTVGSHERRTFTVPRAYLGGDAAFALLCELVASRQRQQTDWITAVPGDRVEWVIGHRLSLSHLMVHR